MKTLKSTYDKISYKGVILIFLMLFIYSSIAFQERNFFTFESIVNLAQKAASDGGFIALGVAVVLLSGGIDLSVGSVLALSGVVTAMAVNAMGAVAGVIVGLACGVICGLINAFIVVKLRVVPFIATFATQLALRALTYLMTDYSTIRVDDGGVFKQLANGSLFEVDYPIYIFAIVVAILVYVTGKSQYGMRLYAVGGNEEATKMMGIDAERVKVMAYVICGVLASLNGILMTARANSGASVAADGWEMTAIASAALGGIKLTGGEGKIGGAVFGILVMTIINTMFNYAGNINTWWRNIIMGAILMVAVMVQSEIIQFKKKKPVVLEGSK